MRYILLFIILSLCRRGLAQEPLLYHYTTKDGLSGNTVYSAFQDSKGFMWFGTNLGISQFDGHSFRNYTSKDGLPDNEVFFLQEDVAGRIWITSYNASISYILNGKVHNAANDVLCRQIEQDSILESLKYINVNRRPSEVLKNVTNLEQRLYAYSFFNYVRIKYRFGLNGRSYFSCYNYIVSAQRDSIITETPFPSMENSFYCKGQLYKWHSSRSKDGKTVTRINRIVPVEGKLQLKDSIFWSSRVYNGKLIDDSTIMIATDHGAVPFSSGMKVPDSSRALLNNLSVSAIEKDSRGNLWFATLGDGIYMRPFAAPVIYKNGIADRKVNPDAICLSSSGKIVAGYRGGIVKVIDGKSILTIPLVASGKQDRMMKMLEGSSDKIIVVTDREHFRVDLNTAKVELISINSSYTGSPKDINLKGGRYLLAHSNGAAEVNPDGASGRRLLEKRATAAAYGHNDIIWIGTVDGVYMHDGQSARKYHGNTTLSRSRITDIETACNNDVIFGTHQNGIFIKNKAGLISIDEADGLSSNICKKILVDNNCNIWVSTNKGIDMIVSADQGKSYVVRHLPLSDLLSENDINDFAVSGQKLYIACSEGIEVIDLKKQRDVPPVQPFIVSVALSDTIFSALDRLEVEHDQNDITINYTGIAPGMGNNTVYKYILEGGKADTVVTTLNVVNLSSLSPGNYKFYVWAKNIGGNWSAAPAMLQVAVRPPFWLRPWFLVLAIGGLTAMIYILVTRRVRQIRTAEKNKTELNRKMTELEMQALRAQINPHFIFNALNSIQNYYSQNDERNANRYLTSFAKLIRQTLTHSRDNWALLSDEIEMIRTYIELEKMRFRDMFDYKIAIDEAIHSDLLMIPAMLIQPYVENAIQHGLRHLKDKSGFLNISFIVRDEQLICIVEDNGVGFAQSSVIGKKTSAHRSMGMEITRNRIETIGQLYNMHIGVTIVDRTAHMTSGRGTRVEILIPLTPETYQHEKANHNNRR